MSGGIKMRTAVGTHGTVHRVADLQKRHDTRQTLPTLLCASEGCGAPARFVPEQAHKNSAPTPGYITLGKDATHQPGCRYHLPGRLQALLASTSAPDFMTTREDGQREMQLLLVQQALKNGAAGATSPDPTLEGYLQLLGDMLEIRGMSGDEALLPPHLTLRLGKKKVDWLNFFYEQHRYDEAWARLGESSSMLPMALLGTVRSHRAPQAGGGNGATYLNCAPKYQQTGVADRRDFYEVSVGHPDAAWLQSFPVGAEIVMFGLWRQGRSSTAARPHPTDPRRTITSITHKLALWPVSARQLVAVD